MRANASTTLIKHRIAARISAVTRYYDRLIQFRAEPWDDGVLLGSCDCEVKERRGLDEPLPDLSGESDRRTGVLLNGTFNYHFDIQELLESMRPRTSRTTRVFAVCYNPYLRWLYHLADRLRLRKGPLPTTFVTHASLASLARISGYEVVRMLPAGFCPWKLLGLGTLLERIGRATPGIRNLSLAFVVVLRPLLPTRERPSLSIIVPARNERGNIEPALTRLPDFGGAQIEVLFVEGHSNDGTWEEIERVVAERSGTVPCRAFRQSGEGKADAVRLGFREASGELVTILDADLTMPPELLTRYYDAWRDGHADFVNGSRLVYPMEGRAMRSLNHLGNVFFAKVLSFLLDVRITDALCGTKLVARHDYERFVRWRRDFGDFDPFGDFELLFPAAILALGTVDVPVRYRDRTYGSTNIRRFAHGFELLKMTAAGFFRIKLGAG